MNRIINPKTLVLLSEGEYSYYSIDGVFRPRRLFIPNEELLRYLRCYPDQAKPHSFDNTQFVAFLSSDPNAVFEPLPYLEWHTNNYQTVSPGDTRIYENKEGE